MWRLQWQLSCNTWEQLHLQPPHSLCLSLSAGPEERVSPLHATAHPFLAWKSLTLLVHLQGCRAEGKLGSGNKLEVQYIILKDVHHIAQPPFCVPLTWCPLAGALFCHVRLLSIDEALATGFACVAPAAPSFFHQGRRATGPPLCENIREFYGRQCMNSPAFGNFTTCGVWLLLISKPSPLQQLQPLAFADTLAHVKQTSSSSPRVKGRVKPAQSHQARLHIADHRGGVKRCLDLLTAKFEPAFQL